jgi:site-specific DNA-methyltransferase (adenine-specific)
MELCRRCILVSTNPGDIVLDPFCGTGAACMAAKGLYREYYGIDTCEEYCTVAKERLGETC